MCPDERYFTPPEIAKALRIRVSRVRDAVRNKELPCLIMGPRTWRIAESDWRQWAERLMTQ